MDTITRRNFEKTIHKVTMNYVNVPRKINIHDILKNKSSFSPHNYKKVILGGDNYKTVKDFLANDLINGEEVGSDAYLRKSHKYFIRNKALQEDSFLLSFVGDSAVPISPSKFIDYHLSEGDLIISKDSNIGETIILDKHYPNHMLSGGLYKMPVEKHKHYLFAFLKHDFFRTQLNFLVSKGATIRHAKKLFLDCLIPLPNQKDSEKVIAYLETLVRLTINKEKKIKENEKLIFSLIEKELSSHQKDVSFKYVFPSLSSILNTSRIDAGFYCEDYMKKQFLIRNYDKDAGSVKDWGFDIGRGQNLQVSAIGNSIYSDTPRDDYYTLIRPTNFSDFGTVTKYEYLGNFRKLSTLSNGDIAFSAEGSVGKCVMFANPKQKMITNIHGIVLNKKDHNVDESSFVCCFLRYLRNMEILDYISVGGQGGSLAMQYWDEVKIPYFSREKRKEITKLYYAQENYKISDDDFFAIEQYDQTINERIGILQLDEQVKALKKRISEIVDAIVSGSMVDINLLFTTNF